VVCVKHGRVVVDALEVERHQPGESRDPWDVPYFGEAFVQAATVREPSPVIPTSLSPGTANASRRSRPVNVWPYVLVAVLVLASIVLRTHTSFGPSPLHPLGLGRSSPPPGHEESRFPLGLPAPVAFPSGSYAFIRLQPGSTNPVTYDPCRPIHYVVNPAGEPLGAQTSVRTAIAAVSAATGLRFVDDGSTSETYSSRRALYQPDRYGQRWAPLLIDFTRAADNPEFADGPVGVGGSSYVGTPDGHLTFVTGSIDIDADEAARVVADSRRVPLSAIIEHELGHVVGLAHVNDMTQLMYPSAGHGITSYGSGDLTGLARLGTGRCEPRL
jgi:matrixin